MRQPSARLTPNTVTFRRTTFGRDAAAGRSPFGTPDAAPVPCAVQPTSAKDLPEHLREASIQYLTVKVYADPNLRNRDVVVDGLGRELVVTGVRGPSGGAGRTWLIDCEYRAPGSGI